MADIRTHYIDTSAIIKLLVREAASDVIRSYCGLHAVFATTSICFAETLGVLKAKYLRKELTQTEYFSTCDELMVYIRDETLQIEDIGVAAQETFQEVERLAKAHNLDISDAYQLVTLKVGFFSQFKGHSQPLLVTADEKLANAARKEGLHAWDCVHEPAP